MKFRLSSFTVFLICLSLPLIVFQNSLMKVNDPVFRNLDEILLLVFFIYSFFLALTNKNIRILFFLNLFIYLYLVLVSIFFGFNGNIQQILLQSFIHLKFFIIAPVFLHSFHSMRKFSYQNFQYIDLVVCSVFWISVVGFFLNALNPDAFYSFFNVDANIRAGGLRIYGLQLKPNDVAFLIGFYLVYRYVCSDFSFNLKYTFLFLLAVVLIIGNGSRVALILPLIVVLHYLLSKKYILVLMIPFLIVSTPYIIETNYIAFIFDETLRNITEFSDIEHSQYVRAIMISLSFDLATGYFPIGTGAATFGSVLAGNSVVYAILGVDHLRFFQEGIGIYDSNLATILGEFGFIGLFIFSLYFLRFYHFYKKAVEDRSSSFFYWSIFSFVCLLVITNPFFMYQYNSFVFHCFVMLIFVRISKND